jgi:hypothetical protein
VNQKDPECLVIRTDIFDKFIAAGYTNGDIVLYNTEKMKKEATLRLPTDEKEESDFELSNYSPPISSLRLINFKS